MKFRTLGRSGLSVSPICLGTMMFGRETNEADSQAIISTAYDAGINFIDTADTYVGGESEGVVGRCIRSQRDAWVLATKVANQMGSQPNQGGLSRKWVMQGCENSLRRLQTDYIDIYYLHKEDLATPLGETVGAIGDLIRAGKVRYFGVSNYRSWRVAEICNICDRLGLDRPVVSQPYYNAMNRMPETEHLPACSYYGLGVAPYSPLARGVLTGKYLPGALPEPGSRVARQDRRIMETEWREESVAKAQIIKEHAAAKGATPIDIAIGWLLNNVIVTSVVAGPRTIGQWQSYMAALDYTFTAEDEALIDGLVVTGHPSSPGYNDPQYRIQGRVSRV